MIKKLFILAIALIMGSNITSAQKVWMTPSGDDFNPEGEVTIYVDLNQCDCKGLVGATPPLYMWTWMPGEPVLGNGAWSGSAEEMQLTDEGDDVWSITFIPTEFYGVDAATVYENDFSFLVKAFDGSAATASEDCGGESKTEDLMLAVSPPATAARKVYSFPDVIPGADTLASTPDDVFTFYYDNKLEEKENLQGVQQFFVYPRGTGSDGQLYKISNLNQVGNNPDLEMKNEGDGIFTFQILPSQFYAEALPEGVTLTQIKFQVIKWPLVNSADAVDGEFFFNFICD